MPEYVKEHIYEKIDGLQSSHERSKIIAYVKILLKFPWPQICNHKCEDGQECTECSPSIFSELTNNKIKSREFLKNVSNILNDKVFGHNDTKQALEETIAKWIFNPDASGRAIGLYGPPGVGKTLISQKLAQALGIPYVEIKLNSLADGHILKGFSYTYIGSQPGLIVKKMTEINQQPCIMYFDELDKTAVYHGSNEIQDILIGLTDPNTNKEFTDNYFDGINFPLNQVFFIFSYNDRSKVDPVLRDRLPEIRVTPYTIEYKINIAQEYLIKEVCKNKGLSLDIDKLIQILDILIDNFPEDASMYSEYDYDDLPVIAKFTLSNTVQYIH
jgi:ATP-dependent Lon protease